MFYVLDRTVALCMTSFLEAFQKVADMATGTRGTIHTLPLFLLPVQFEPHLLISDDRG